MGRLGVFAIICVGVVVAFFVWCLCRAASMYQDSEWKDEIQAQSIVQYHSGKRKIEK